MKGKTKKSEAKEVKGVMVGGAMRPKKMYEGGKLGTSGTARGMGAAVKGGKFTDL